MDNARSVQILNEAEVSSTMYQLVDLFHTLVCKEDHSKNCEYYEVQQIDGFQKSEVFREWHTYVNEVLAETEYENPEALLEAYKSISGLVQSFGKLSDQQQLLFVILIVGQTDGACE